MVERTQQEYKDVAAKVLPGNTSRVVSNADPLQMHIDAADSFKSKQETGWATYSHTRPGTQNLLADVPADLVIDGQERTLEKLPKTLSSPWNVSTNRLIIERANEVYNLQFGFTITVSANNSTFALALLDATTSDLLIGDVTVISRTTPEDIVISLDFVPLSTGEVRIVLECDSNATVENAGITVKIGH